MYVVGSQSYEGRSSMIAAHVRPSSVPGTYFMSMYALLEGDITTFAPCVTAGGTLSLFHCCTTVVGRNRPRPTSSHPMYVFPLLYTMSCTRSTNFTYCGSCSTCTSSPPRWM
jgi:hypothetical protein